MTKSPRGSCRPSCVPHPRVPAQVRRPHSCSRPFPWHACPRGHCSLRKHPFSGEPPEGAGEARGADTRRAAFSKGALLGEELPARPFIQTTPGSLSPWLQSPAEMLPQEVCSPRWLWRPLPATPLRVGGLSQGRGWQPRRPFTKPSRDPPRVFWVQA